MPIDWGFNFRAGGAFVTDGAAEAFTSTESYPHTYTVGGDSVVAGWESSGLSSRDRNAAADRRLAGLVFNGGAGGDNFRVDLPVAGDYEVHAAFGDDSFGQTIALLLRDGTTTFATISGTTAGGHFLDAGNTDRTDAAWPGSEVAVTRTFATTILRVTDNGAGSGIWLAHLRVKTATAAAPVPKRTVILNQAVMTAVY